MYSRRQGAHRRFIGALVSRPRERRVQVDERVLERPFPRKAGRAGPAEALGAGEQLVLARSMRRYNAAGRVSPQEELDVEGGHQGPDRPELGARHLETESV